MEKSLTQDEKTVREELKKLWPQLQINERKILGSAYDRYSGDLMAVAVEYFLNKPIENQLKAIKEGKMEHYITFIANVQAKSSTTKFYNLYKKHSLNQRVLYVDYNYGDNYLNKNGAFHDEESEVYTCMKKL